MKVEESVVVTKFHSETVTVGADDSKSGEKNSAKVPPKYKYRYDLKEGDHDEKGRKIEYIYDCEEGKYFIYHIDGFDLQYVAEDETLIGKNLAFNKLMLQMADFLSNAPELRQKYISHIVFALKNLFDGNDPAAIDAMNATLENMRRYLRRRSVAPYMLGASLMVLISLLTYFITYRFGDLNDFGQMLFSAVVLSSLGGLLSVAISLRNIDVDLQDSFWRKTLYGSVRIVIAMISGVIMYFLIEGKIAFSFLKDIQLADAYYIAFFVSGFSEKLIANMMLDFEKKGFAAGSSGDVSNK